MAMIVPVPHYEMCVEFFLKSEKKCVGVTRGGLAVCK